MSRTKESLKTLVLATFPPEDLSTERSVELITLCESILSEYGDVGEHSEPSQIGDVIKKKLWKDNNAPEKAVRFTNLYSRLLTLPIMTKKWAILHLLDQLSTIETSGSFSEDRGEDKVPNDNRLPEKTTRSKKQPDSESTRSSLQDASSARLNQRPIEGSNVPSERVGSLKPIGLSSHGKTAVARSYQPKQKDSGTEFVCKSSLRPSEWQLLRDLPFVLQGLSTSNMQFASDGSLNLPSGLPLPILSVLYVLAEPALLYRSLSEFVQARDEGLISQSLRAAISIELRSYLGLIATLESEIKSALKSVDQTLNAAKAVGVTLKRAVVWTREATLGLRLMSHMAEESKNKKGGQLISLIHSYSISYGDPFTSAFASRMLDHLTKPFYDMLRLWIYDGELLDPYREFFVIEHEEDKVVRELDPRRHAATSVWEDKYMMDKVLVPTIMTDDFAKKVFLIGKSLNFIRYGCGDSSWVEAYSKDASKELKYGDTATLEFSIDKAYNTTMARLIHLMDKKFRLFEHLNALKSYLLLSQGDFVALLMESLASNLDRPAGSQYRHTLTAQLEHAIRGSNAQYDSPDVLRRLDARLLELSHGDIGWDVFTLEYKVDAPVDVVITQWANKQYLVVFNFLWRIKRVEFALGTTWKRFMTGARGVLGSVDDKLGRDWKVARCVVAEMIHFINQLQYYILFEVIEASWDQLQLAFHKPNCTLDDLIYSHNKYLKNITHKGLLGSTRSPITGQREDSFMSQLHYLLKVMLAYKDAVDGLYSFSVAEFTRRQEFKARIETRTAAGQWGRTEKDDDDFNSPLPGPGVRLRNKGLRSSESEGKESPFPPSLLAQQNDDQMLPALRKRLEELSVDFKVRLATLLGDLMIQPDPDLKFLGVVMNFNDVYKPHRRKKDRKDRPMRTPATSKAEIRSETREEIRTESRSQL